MWSEERDKTLFDYYTKSMTLHATITVAVIFGLFSLLGIISNTSHFWARIGLTMGYAVLVIFGYYEIGRYFHYGNEAKKKGKLFGAKDAPDKYRYPIEAWFFRQASRMFKKAKGLFAVLMIALWFFVAVL